MWFLQLERCRSNTYVRIDQNKKSENNFKYIKTRHN